MLGDGVFGHGSSLNRRHPGLRDKETEASKKAIRQLKGSLVVGACAEWAEGEVNTV